MKEMTNGQTGRIAKKSRKTTETDINIFLNLDGTGQSECLSGSGFFDHMLTSFAKHGKFDLNLVCKGDMAVDAHHSIEDIGIVLGQAFAECLGDKAGICRFGNAFVPMDETLVQAVVDLSGRPYLYFNARYDSPKVGDFETEIAKEFFLAFAMNAKITLHINLCYGENTHHILEAMFKSTARALKEAVKIEGGGVPSTKGCL